nr:MAG TPA: DNA polymerase I [Caudoviricetes sp.]
MHLLFLDTETYSPEALSGALGVGAYKYAEHPEAAVALTAYALDDAPVRVLGEPGDDPDEWDEYAEFFCMLHDPEYLKIAHNASFDRVQLSAYVCGRGTGHFLDPAQWADTMHIAALSGLPRGLDNLAAALCVEGKDSAGPALIRRFAVPQRATKKRLAGRIYGFQEPEKWADYVHYCARDVETLRDVWHALEADPYADTTIAGAERDVEVASERVNDAGMPVDLSLVADGIAAERRARAALYGQLQEITGLENPASTPQLTWWLKGSCARLADLADVRRKTLEALLDDPEGLPGNVIRAVRLRVDLARTSGRKLHVLNRATGAGGCIRGCFQYAGAHTGRWAGRLYQPQNLPREQLPAGESVESVQAAIRRGVRVPQTTVSALVRPAIGQPGRSILVCDYSSIEAIVLAWLAREQWVIDAYREKRDLYVETASRMSASVGHEMSRQEGKVALLGAGYGSGVTGLRTFAGPDPTDEQLQTQINAWRAANSAIVALWHRLEAEFKSGGPIIRAPQRDVRVLTLPSGRRLTYRGVHATLNRWGQPSVAYFDPVKKHDVETYGGRLAENLTQAVARDVLAAALVRLQGAGFKVVGHVHDEVIIEGPGSWVDAAGMPSLEGGRAFAEVRRLMTEPNPWSITLPLRAAGAVMPRYGKPSDEQEEVTELAARQA